VVSALALSGYGVSIQGRSRIIQSKEARHVVTRTRCSPRIITTFGFQFEMPPPPNAVASPLMSEQAHDRLQEPLVMLPLSKQIPLPGLIRRAKRRSHAWSGGNHIR
jgi:hypothetical protein